MLIINLLLFFVSLKGYNLIFTRIFKYKKEQALLLSICGILILTYFAELASIIDFVVYTIHICGCLIFLVFLISDFRNKNIKTPLGFDVFTMFLFLFVFVLGVILLYTPLTHYDNFSHWALLPKFIHYQSALPTVEDTIIGFFSYPPGSTSFIVYVTKIIGFSEGAMLFAQFLLIVACFNSILSSVNKEIKVHMIIVLGAIALMLQFNQIIRFNTLLVDFLIAIMGVAAISGTYQYRKSPFKMTLYVILINSSLLLVKNSALFFTVASLIYYMYTLFEHNRNYRKKYFLVLITLILVFIPFLLWRYHVSANFSNIVSKHDMNIDSYKDVFSSKSFNDIRSITFNIIKSIFSIRKGVLTSYLILMTSTITIYYIYRHQIVKESIVKFVLIIFGTNVLYIIGILLMYIFSMPLGESRKLAGFNRYISTILVYNVGLMLLYFLNSISNEKYTNSHFTRLLYSLIGIVSVIIMSKEILYLVNNINNYKNTRPFQVKSIVGDSTNYNEKNYLIISNNEKNAASSGYISYIGKYYLATPHVKAKYLEDYSDESIVDLMESYDYLIVLDDVVSFKEKFKQEMGKDIKRGLYLIDDLPLE